MAQPPPPPPPSCGPKTLVRLSGYCFVWINSPPKVAKVSPTTFFFGELGQESIFCKSYFSTMHHTAIQEKQPPDCSVGSIAKQHETVMLEYDK